MNHKELEKESILQGLLITEEESLERLNEIVGLAKKLFKIDAKSGELIIQLQELTILERICIYLIGNYYSVELGITEEEGISLSDLASACGTKASSLTRPIAELKQSGYVAQFENKRYYIRHFMIEQVLLALNEKHLEKKPGAMGIKVQYKPQEKRKNSGKQDGK